MGVLSRGAGLSRRGFILASLSAAGGLMIGIRPVEAATPDSAGAELGAWIVIDPDESVTLRVAKSEMGQGIFTALPMILAEELACDWRYDLHALIELVERGCEPALAARILAPLDDAPPGTPVAGRARGCDRNEPSPSRNRR